MKRKLLLFTAVIYITMAVFGVETAMARASSDKATVICVGDLMCLGGQIYAGRTRKGYSFDYVFDGVRKKIASADLAVGNLETPVAGGKAGYTKTGQTGLPVLNAPYDYVKAVKKAGFDIVTTANNHTLDKYESGIRATIKNLRRAGLAETGTFISKKAQRYVVKKVNGIRIAVVSYCAITYNSKEGRISREKQSYMLNKYSEKKAKRDIKEAKKKADAVIVYVHWGEENTNKYNNRQAKIAKEIANAGADVIVGMHPHVLQRLARTKANDGRSVITAYSLGNFTSSMPRVINRDSVMLRLYVKKVRGKVKITADYIPVRTESRFKVTMDVSKTSRARIKKVMGKTFPMKTK